MNKKPRTVLDWAIENNVPCPELTIQQQEEEIARLQGEVAALREALSDAVAFAEDALLELPQSYVKKYRLTEDAAGFKKALASDAGVQEAAVIAASIALRENELMTEENSGMSEWSLADAAGCLVSEWREAVDALLGKEA